MIEGSEQRVTRSGNPAQPPERDGPDGSRPVVGLRWGRVLGVGIPLIVANNYWIAFSEMRTGVTEITITAPFMGVIFLLCLGVGLNALVGRIAPRLRLSRAELLLLYFMLNVSSSVGGVGAVGFFLPYLGNITWYADDSNRWERFHGNLPHWFAPLDRQWLRPFYLGSASIFSMSVFRAWAVPLCLWGAFFFVLIGVALCITSLLRRQWVDADHLPFPTTVLPIEMTREDGGFFGHRAMWTGFALPFVIQTFNTLQSMYPAVPTWKLNQFHDLHPWFTEKPWSGVDAVFMALHPCALGLIFLAPIDVSFSAWFFYVLKKCANIVGVSQGWRDPDLSWGGIWTNQFPFAIYQGVGAWLALTAVGAFMARGTVRRVLAQAWHGERSDPEQEVMSERTAVLGIVLGGAFLTAYGYALGAPWWLPPLFLALYFGLVLSFSRALAEIGPPSASLDYSTPHTILVDLIGSKQFTTQGLVSIAGFAWFNLDTRANFTPRHFEAMRIAGAVRMRLRPIATAVLIAAAVAVPSALLCSLHMYYLNGAATAKVNPWRIDMGKLPWWMLDGWQRDPHGPRTALLGAGAFGAAVTLGLSALRSRWIGFPLHPVAYALASTFSVDGYWFDFFAGWLCKSLILRYSGMRGYRNALPFFLGLTLGDFMAGAGWSLIGTIMNLDLYRTFPT